MNFKKTASCLLSATMIFSSLALYAPVKAESINTDEYWDKVKSVSEWKKVESSSKSNASAEISHNSEKMSFGYDIDITAKSDINDFKSEIEVKITPKNEASPAVPNIKAYFDEQSFYINKEAFNAFAEYTGIEKEITKDFVKIDFKNLGDSSDFNMSYLKNASKNSSQMTEKIINFVKKIDLGIDLGLTKKDEKTYSLSWDSDKIVDVTNAYFKYIFSNFDVVEKFYKEVFDIDIYEMYKEAGTEITKEKMQEYMKISYAMWVSEVEPLLPKIKEIIKGSSFTMEETFEVDAYNSKVSFDIVVDANKVESLLNELSSVEDSEKDTATNPQKNEIKLSLNSNQTSKNSQDLKITLPSSYDTFDYAAYMEEQEKKWEEEMKALEAEAPTSDNSDETLKVVFTISPSKKTIVMDEYGEITKTTVDCEVRNGTLYVSKADIEKMLTYELSTEEKYLPFKATMEEEGYTVKWDAKTHTVVASLEF